jgi:hypothetical protein
MEQENENIKCGRQDNCDCGSCCNKKAKCGCGATSGGIYGLAFIGALIYYIQHAETFWQGVLGFFKALVWPAILVYKFLELLIK